MAGGAGAPVGMVVAVSSCRVVVAKRIEAVQSHWWRRIPVRHMRLYLYFLFELNEAGSGVLISFEHRLPPMILPQTAEMLLPPPPIDKKLLLRSTYHGQLTTMLCCLLLLHNTIRDAVHNCLLHTSITGPLTDDVRRSSARF